MEIYGYFHIYLHSFTIVVLGEKDIECETSCRFKHFHEVPGWRNWQTQRTQNPPVLSTLGVQLPLPAPFKYPMFMLIVNVMIKFFDRHLDGADAQRAFLLFRRWKPTPDCRFW